MKDEEKLTCCTCSKVSLTLSSFFHPFFSPFFHPRLGRWWEGGWKMCGIGKWVEMVGGREGEGGRGGQRGGGGQARNGPFLPVCFSTWSPGGGESLSWLLAALLKHTQPFALVKPAVLNLCVGSESASLHSHGAAEHRG